jgi:molecular chaperone DnaJ
LHPPRRSQDYYHLLGVRSQADAQEIKKAFRRKAVTVHPDANANLTGSSRQFVELNDAYRTLRDPVLRHHYDINRHHLLRWREHPHMTFPGR